MGRAGDLPLASQIWLRAPRLCDTECSPQRSRTRDGGWGGRGRISLVPHQAWGRLRLSCPAARVQSAQSVRPGQHGNMEDYECVCWGGCPCAAGTVLDFQWPGQESLSFPWPLQALILETSRPGNSGRMHGGLGIYKYLQIFLVLVDVMEFEDVRVLDELQDGYLPLHLGKRNGGRSALPPSLSPAPKGPLSPNAQTHLHQHRLRQLLPVHDLDGHLLARDAVDPEFNQT